MTARCICQTVNRNTHKAHTCFRRRQADTRTSSSAHCSLGFAQSCRWALCTWTSMCSEHSTSTNASSNIPHPRRMRGRTSENPLGGDLAVVHTRLISFMLLILHPHLLQLHKYCAEWSLDQTIEHSSQPESLPQHRCF